MKYTDISLFLIRNKLLKWIVLVLIFFIFLISSSSIKRFAFPKVELYEMTITTIAPNYSVDEVEKNITAIIEDELETIGGIDEYSSTSSESVSFINLELDRESDIDDVKEEIRNAIDGINDFPDVVEDRPDIQEIKVDNLPIFVLGITAADDDFEKIKFHTLKIKEELLRLKPVSEVREINLPDKKIWVYLDEEKMLANKITFEEVISALRKNNISVTAGNLESGGSQKNIVTLREFENLTDIANVIVRVTRNFNSDDGISLRIKDLGSVVEGFDDLNAIERFNGKLAAGLEVLKKANADTIDTAEEILKKINFYQESIEGSGIDIIIHRNDAEETETRIDIALNNGILGLFLVFIILILFLNYKIAIWTAVGLPFVFFMNITLMKIFDLSINNISLAGIIITLGIIVDNAVIVGESIFRFKQMGYNEEASVLKSLRGVIKPLIFALLTTILSFVSMFFIPGVIGDFAVEIPLVVIFMLTISFLESTIILPSHLATASFRKKKSLGIKLIDGVSFYYQKTLRFALKRPWKSLLFITGFFLSMGFVAAQNVSFFLFPIDQAFYLAISGEVNDKNSTKEATLLEVKKIEQVISSLPEEGIVSSYKVKAGGTQENQFHIDIYLTSYFTRQTTAEEVKDYILNKIEDKKKFNLTKVDYYIDGGGPPQDKPIEINVFGFDDEKRLKAIEEIIAKLEEKDYISQVQSDYDEGREGIELKIKENAYYASLNPESIANNVRFSLSGITVGKMNQDGENIDIDVKFAENELNQDDFLKGIFVLNDFRQLVEVKKFLSVQQVTNKLEIKRKNGRRVNIVTANFDNEKISAQEVNSLLLEEISVLNENNGDVDITLAGESVESTNVFNQLLIAIIASVIGIYLLLVLQFNNFIQPIMVIVSIPFGIVGILTAFSLQGFNLSLLAMIGILGFGGVVINASLIMVDFINRLKSGGYSELGVDPNVFSGQKNIVETIIYGSNLRLRPIIITTLTTLLGIMPSAYGLLGKTDSTISPMTLAMFWGLLFGTMVSLFLVPLGYLLIERIKKDR